MNTGIALLSALGIGSVLSIVVTKLFDFKLERAKAAKEIENTKIVTEAARYSAEGKEAVETIIAANHILVAENERLSRQLKECNDSNSKS